MQGMQGQLLLPHMMGQMNPQLMHQQQMINHQQQQMLRQQMGLQQGELTSTTARCSISPRKNQNKKEKSFFVCFSFIFVKLFL